MIGYRHTDRRFAFLWESAAQPAGRWHATGDGPCHYFADTPDGAWAEFLRHEEITAAEDLETIDRALWAAELPEHEYAEPSVPEATLTGALDTYEECQAEAQRLLALGATGVIASSAALKPGGAAGWRVEGGLQRGPSRDGKVLVLFGPRPQVLAWRAAVGRPSADLLPWVNHLPLAR